MRRKNRRAFRARSFGGNQALARALHVCEARRLAREQSLHVADLDDGPGMDAFRQTFWGALDRGLDRGEAMRLARVARETA